LRQQLLPKLLLAQTPTAPNRLELLAFLRPTPFLYISISRTDPFSFSLFDPFLGSTPGRAPLAREPLVIPPQEVITSLLVNKYRHIVTSDR
jgi:hypothetical protein